LTVLFRGRGAAEEGLLDVDAGEIPVIHATEIDAVVRQDLMD